MHFRIRGRLRLPATGPVPRQFAAIPNSLSKPTSARVSAAHAFAQQLHTH